MCWRVLEKRILFEYFGSSSFIVKVLARSGTKSMSQVRKEAKHNAPTNLFSLLFYYCPTFLFLDPFSKRVEVEVNFDLPARLC